MAWEIAHGKLLFACSAIRRTYTRGGKSDLCLPWIETFSMRSTHIPNPNKLRALVVHGHRETADSLGELLAVCGQDVLVVYEQKTVCDLARLHRPDVVLLDLRMHGQEMARLLREQPTLHDTALVAITGPSQEEMALGSARHGFSHFLVEPVDPVQVQALLKKLKNPR